MSSFERWRSASRLEVGLPNRFATGFYTAGFSFGALQAFKGTMLPLPFPTTTVLLTLKNFMRLNHFESLNIVSEEKPTLLI